jgi:hypothetical protein
MRLPWPAVFVICLVALTPVPAHATSCSNAYASQDRAFLVADAVFSGVLVASKSGRAEFKVNEWYKTPSQEYASKEEATVSFNGSDGGFTGQEYIVFAGIKRVRDYVYHLVNLPCLWGTTLSPTYSLKLLSEGPSNPHYSLLLIHETHRLIFRGAVVNAYHWVNPNAGHPTVESELTFDIKEVFKNTTSDPHLKDPRNVSVRVTSCGQDFYIGEEYLISAVPSWLGRRPDDDHSKRRRGFRISCMPTAPFAANVQAKEHLKELRDLSQQKRQER